MGMTDKQFCGYLRLILATVSKALKKMPECEEKDDLKRMAENLQKTIEDQLPSGNLPNRANSFARFSFTHITQTANNHPTLFQLPAL
ncbi:MAG: hypothetical protein NC078_11290 [Ruminococcus sp.]|nr:hypothetical protein [Ruminococcus sp.]